MDIVISTAVEAPIYEQIKAQIKKQIVTGQLRGDQPLPSIRVLAQELKISVITIKRAYEELEREGLIYTYVGKGSFVCPLDEKAVRQEHLREFTRRALSLKAFYEETLEGDGEAMDILMKIFSSESEENGKEYVVRDGQSGRGISEIPTE